MNARSLTAGRLRYKLGLPAMAAPQHPGERVPGYSRAMVGTYPAARVFDAIQRTCVMLDTAPS